MLTLMNLKSCVRTVKNNFFRKYGKIIRMKSMILTVLIIFTVSINSISSTRFISVVIKKEKFIIEIADTENKKVVGLMYRKNIPQNFGMLFTYPNEDYRGMWMKNTLINLDLIFLNKDKEIIDIKHNVPPCENDPCKTYISKRKAQFVLEIKGKKSKELDLKEGDRISFIL